MSNSIRIVHIEPLPDWIQGIYDSAFEAPEYDLAWASDFDDSELSPALRDTDVILTGKRRVTAENIQAASPTLQLIQVVGRAPWAADLGAAGNANVPVSFLPHRGAIAVAEHAIALLLGVMRKLVPGHIGTTSADYRTFDIEPIRTSERVIAFNWLKFSDIQQLYGKTIGLVGLGDIGLEMARRARAFDMDVLYTKRDQLPLANEQMAGVRFAPFHELLSQSDVVSIHAPQTDETFGFIDESAFALMKESAVLINTARGGLVDEGAMVDALRSGSIAGAGLDVFLDEPLPERHPLLDLGNVLLSPHVGGGTGGGQKGVVTDIKANIDRIRGGQTPHHLAAP